MRRFLLSLFLLISTLLYTTAQSKDNYSFIFEYLKEANASDTDAQKCKVSLYISDNSHPILMMFNRDNGEKQREKLMGFIVCDDENILHFPTEDNSAVYSIGIMPRQGQMQVRIIVKQDDGSGIPKPFVELFNKEGEEYAQKNYDEFMLLLKNAKNSNLKLYEVDVF